MGKVRLVIELDNEAHAEPPQAEQDMERDDWLAVRGYRVLRFRNTGILEKAEQVLKGIREAVAG